MSSDKWTTKEVADYLRVSEKTVEDWARNGQLAGEQACDGWRFSRVAVEKFNQSGTFQPLFPTAILSRENVVVVENAEKNAILQALIDSLAGSPMVKSKEELQDGIFHREQLMSTGIGMEIGIPHVRIGSVKDVILAAALVRQGVADYEALDSRPVKLIFMIVARKEQHDQHLKLLALISSRLKDESYRQALIGCPDADAFHALLTAGRGC